MHGHSATHNFTNLFSLQKFQSFLPQTEGRYLLKAKRETLALWKPTYLGMLNNTAILLCQHFMIFYILPVIKPFSPTFIHTFNNSKYKDIHF
jgi:hypothetical protein